MDIDETILVTHARVLIKKDNKVIARLRNHEYLAYKPKKVKLPIFLNIQMLMYFIKHLNLLKKQLNEFKECLNIFRKEVQE